MTLTFRDGECGDIYVDCDGVAARAGGPQGLDVSFRGGLTLHFENEEDAAEVARKILARLGISFTPEGHAWPEACKYSS